MWVLMFVCICACRIDRWKQGCLRSRLGPRCNGTLLCWCQLPIHLEITGSHLFIEIRLGVTSATRRQMTIHYWGIRLCLFTMKSALNDMICNHGQWWVSRRCILTCTSLMPDIVPRIWNKHRTDIGTVANWNRLMRQYAYFYLHQALFSNFKEGT